MSFFISKSQPALQEEENGTGAASNGNSGGEDQLEEAEMLREAVVSSHVHLKPAHSNEKLNKEVVLRRIRQRKRVNKVRAVLQGFVGGHTDSSTSDSKFHVRWVDDAFAAP